MVEGVPSVVEPRSVSTEFRVPVDRSQGSLRQVGTVEEVHVSCATCSLAERPAFRPQPATLRPAVSSPESAFEVFRPRFDGLDREVCLAAMVDTKHRLLGVRVVSIGSIDHTFMGPREILRDALLANASAVVVAHNHPSGDPEPSRDDELVTRRLAEASTLVGVDLLDHLVVAGDAWVSLARRGCL